MSLIQLTNDMRDFGATVSGIAKSFSLSDEPQKLLRELLPALVIGNFLGGNNAGFMPTTMLGNAPQQEVQLDHVMLLAGFDLKVEQTKLQVLAATMSDAYVAAAMSYKFFTYDTNPVKQVPITFTTRLQVATVNGQAYFALIFHHEYLLYL